MRLAAILALCVGLSAPAATLEKLSELELIRKSTEIVEGQVVSVSSVLRGNLVYTTYKFQVKEAHKGNLAGAVDVAVLGGRYGQLIQQFPGSPSLTEGQEYLLFLWTGRSGLHQVIGLSQGLFRVNQTDNGEVWVYRAAATETMLDSTGKPVGDSPVTMPYKEMISRIRRALSGAQK